VLDTKTRPKKLAKPASRPRQHPKPDPDRRRGKQVHRDVILGAVTGFAVALGFGGPILSALASFWSGAVVPAFYTLAQAGLAYCT